MARAPQTRAAVLVERVRIAAPASEDALLAYLASVKHVGPTRRGVAARAPRRVGAARRSTSDPGGRLGEVPGIGARRLPAAVPRGRSAAASGRSGCSSTSTACRPRPPRAWCALCGTGAIEQLRTDPYSATEVEGIGFATADALARALGLPADDPARIEAGMVHALREAEADGHCHLPRAELEQRAAQLLGAPAPTRARIGGLGAGRLVLDGGRVAGPADRRGSSGDWPAACAELLDAEAVLKAPWRSGRPEELSDDQWRAIRQAHEHRLSILTGAGHRRSVPRCARWVDVVRAANRAGAALRADWASAARRLAESTGHDATTIHRLLESSERGGRLHA